jgi:hypothetical protein
MFLGFATKPFVMKSIYKNRSLKAFFYYTHSKQHRANKYELQMNKVKQ